MPSSRELFPAWLQGDSEALGFAEVVGEVLELHGLRLVADAAPSAEAGREMYLYEPLRTAGALPLEALTRFWRMICPRL